MKTTRPYELKERIYQLCNKEQYFTAGDNMQYGVMFDAAVREEISSRDLAAMIWICSVTANLDEVQEQLEEICKEIEAEAAAETEVEFYEYETMEE